MLPLTRQVQIAMRHGEERRRAPRGVEAPKFEDNEKTIEELQARIAKTIDYVKSVPANAFEGSEDRDIKIPCADRTLEMKGLAVSARLACCRISIST